MKRFILFFVIVVLFVIPLKSIDISLGFNYHFGKTFVDKWKLIDFEDTTLEEWDSKFSGYFIQAFIILNKIDLGIEFGESRYYYISGSQPVKNSWSVNAFWETYESMRLLGIAQLKIYDSLKFQLGLGIYTQKTRYRYETPPFLGLMASLRYSIRIWNFFEIPLFARFDLNGIKGMPLALSFGTGLVIRWKSGL